MYWKSIECVLNAFWMRSYSDWMKKTFNKSRSVELSWSTYVTYGPSQLSRVSWPQFFYKELYKHYTQINYSNVAKFTIGMLMTSSNCRKTCLQDFLATTRKSWRHVFSVLHGQWCYQQISNDTPVCGRRERVEIHWEICL